MGTVVSMPLVVSSDKPTVELRTLSRSDEAAANGKRAPGRKSNAEHGREREYLSEAEVEQLIVAAGLRGRYGHRDATLILLCYRHGLRVSELASLRWSQIDLKGARIHIKRVKNGISGIHPLSGRELRALRKLRRDNPGTEHLFMSERGAPMSPAAAQKVVREAGKRAGIASETMRFPIHIHMLRHSCGYALINKGTDVRIVQQWLGHASISNTVMYTRLDATRFNDLWHD